MIKYKLLLTSLISSAALLPTPLHAAVITLTGGDPEDGFSTLPQIIAAKDVGSTNGVFIQGIGFDGDGPHPNVEIGGGFNSGAFSFLTSTTLNDNQMTALLSNQYFGAPTIAVVLHLTPGTTYQIDSLVAQVGSATTMTQTVSAQGAGSPVVDTSTILGASEPDFVPHSAYDFRQFVTADSEGSIVVTYSALNGPPVLGGVVVSAVPEPSTAIFVIFGSALLFRRNRNG